MEYAFLGSPDARPTLRLDYRAFAYAGKFVVGSTGKAVFRTPDGSPAAPEWEPSDPLPASVDPASFDDDVIAAVSFSADRTDPACCRLRYIAVHVDRRGEGIGPALVARTLKPIGALDFETVRIAVNNPFAYEALYKVGFTYTGEQTGVAELVLERPVKPTGDRIADGSEIGAIDRYRAGLDRFRDRDPSDPEATFLAERVDGTPPPRIE